MLDPSAMITTTANDSMSIRYANEQTMYAADILFPPVYCDKETTKIYQADGSNFRVSTDESDSLSEADSVDGGYFSTTKTLTLKKLKADVDPNAEAQVDRPVADLENEAAMLIMDRLLIAKEVRAATKAGTSSNYPSDLTQSLAAGATWATTGGDPRAISKTARLAVKARCGRKANALFLSDAGFETLALNEALRDQTKYTSGQSIPMEVIKNLMGVDFIFVGAAQKNVNVQGNATQTLTDIWADIAIFFVYDPAPRLKKVCYGIQPIFKQFYSYQYEDPKRGGPAGRIKVLEKGWSYSLDAGAVISSSDTDFAAGYLVENIY